MPAYQYTGLSAKGKNIKGVTTAESVAALKAALKREGVYLTGVSETTVQAAAAAQGGGGSREIDLSRFFDRVSQKMVAQTTRLLGTLLHAGVTLPESLRALTDQVESQRFKGILSDIAERVNEGSSLADAMARYPNIFPGLYVNMIRAGEASGALETVLFRLAEFMEKQLELNNKVTSAMFYPIILSVLGSILMIILMVAVVPKITAMFGDMGEQLPWNTKLLIFISDSVAAYWWALIIVAIAVFFIFRNWRRSESGRLIFDSMVLRMPVLGDLVRKIAIARFARTLSTLLASGVQLLQALDIVKALLGNVILEKVVTQARDNIREGQGIAPALKHSGQFPPLVTHMIGVGERSGQLEQMLTDVADAYDRESSVTIQRFTALLEPIMIVIMGVSIGFVVFSVMGPIMKMTEIAGKT